MQKGLQLLHEERELHVDVVRNMDKQVILLQSKESARDEERVGRGGRGDREERSPQQQQLTAIS